MLQRGTVFGVYVHFPYCKKRCPYCDFAVHARRNIPHERYRDAVLAELELRTSLYKGQTAGSLYFGGGTPSLWDPECVRSVIAAVAQAFGLRGEITLEANPDDLPTDRLAAYRAAGVNRLSIGVQSFRPASLELLGRLHDGAQVKEAVRNARRAGFENLSLDLIYGLPSQTAKQLDADLDRLLALEPDHVSIYGLTFEPRTAFAGLQRRGELSPMSADDQAELYERVRARLCTAGFSQYEISSWARHDRYSRHNRLYWTSGEYLGLGCSAHSLKWGPATATRFASVRSVDRYFEALPRSSGALAESDSLLQLCETLDVEARTKEAMWLGLRLIEGIDRVAFASCHGTDPAVKFAAALAPLCDRGWVEITPDRVRLSTRGVLYADEVGQQLL